LPAVASKNIGEQRMNAIDISSSESWSFIGIVGLGSPMISRTASSE
jgi:hypothetical protein